MVEKVIVKEQVNKLIVSTPGTQGPRGRTILNGYGAPSANLGLEGDFYYDKDSTRLYGPKEVNTTWAGVTNYLLNTDVSYVSSWELANLTGPVNQEYSLTINHNLQFHPNVTVKSSSGDIMETGISYDNINTITLTMAQPFSGVAYLS